MNKRIAIIMLLSVAFTCPAQQKVSRPFEYSGWSEAQYKSYIKTSMYVEMLDGVRIAVDVFLPAEGPADAPKCFPTVFQFTPYGRAFAIPEKVGGIQKLKMKIGVGTTSDILDRANCHDAMYGSNDYIVRNLLSHGYAYVCGDVRGTGASTGVKIDFMPQIGTDGAAVIDWIAQQPWSDGKVGMFGGSYLGYSQLVIAAQKPAALKCIFPEVVAFDGYSSEIRPGGCFVSLYASEDLQRFYELNYYRPDEYIYPTAPALDEDGDGDYADEIPIDINGNGTFLDDYNYPDDPNDEPQYADGQKRRHVYFLLSKEHLQNYPYNNIGNLGTYIDQPITLGTMTATPYEVSPSAAVPAIMESGIAVYNHGSWMDDFIRGTTELFCTMQGANPSKMTIDPGYHETESPFWKYCGESEKKGIKAYGVELLRFYDRWLKGIPNGIDTEPPVYIYNMNGDGWRFENEWPLKRQQRTDFYMSADHSLNTHTPITEGYDKYLIDTKHNSSWESSWYDYGVSRWVMCAVGKTCSHSHHKGYVGGGEWQFVVGADDYQYRCQHQVDRCPHHIERCAAQYFGILGVETLPYGPAKPTWSDARNGRLGRLRRTHYGTRCLAGAEHLVALVLSAQAHLGLHHILGLLRGGQCHNHYHPGDGQIAKRRFLRLHQRGHHKAVGVGRAVLHPVLEGGQPGEGHTDEVHQVVACESHRQGESAKQNDQAEYVHPRNDEEERNECRHAEYAEQQHPRVLHNPRLRLVADKRSA